MKCFLSILMTAAAVLQAPAAELSAPLQDAFESYCALAETLTPILGSVQDRATADAAAPKLHAELNRIAETYDKLKVAKDLTEPQKQEIEKRYATRMRTEWGKLYSEMFRLNRVQCYRCPAFAKEYGNMNMMLAQ